jgi:hypothetical protein
MYDIIQLTEHVQFTIECFQAAIEETHKKRPLVSLSLAIDLAMWESVEKLLNDESAIKHFGIC